MVFEDVWRTLVWQGFDEGVEVDRRNGRTFERLNVAATWPAVSGILVNEGRAMRMDFAKTEALWILDGRNDLAPLVNVIKGMADYSDNGKVMSGAYGPHWVAQRTYVLDTLRTHPHSRQAVVSIWQPRPSRSADIPCTISWQFMLVDGHLDMFVNMRSSDIWLGLPYDAFSWSVVLIDTALSLGVPYGNVHYHATTLHLYERHERAAEQSLFSIPEEENYARFPAFDSRDELRKWLNDIQ